ncbi:MAG: 3-deoxy-7-phosphoheptulonate synthase [Spirochaetes bacterium]|nr:3-deoxy-7-phosphoheptulonate synthase [Spirochaetota bacterium]
MATCNADPSQISCNSSHIATPSLPLYSKSHCDETVINLPYNVQIASSTCTIIAGPCSIESEDQIMATAEFVKRAGATILRGGAFKPRTSPYAFQGMGVEGLKLLRKAGDTYSMPIITEVLDSEDIYIVSEYADILQVGARNCQNFSLLRKLGRIQKPVLLKRGMMVTIKEFLMAAEYILAEGNKNVILCERGIRTFETETRNTLDISAVPVLKQKTHLPVIVDPSHAAGNWKLIHPLALAALAAGADGLMIECHINPEIALCDGEQSLRPDKFALLMEDVKKIISILKSKTESS